MIHRPELLHLWFPGIVGCHVENGTRTITLNTGISMVEQLLTNDSLQRRFQYRIASNYEAPTKWIPCSR